MKSIIKQSNKKSAFTIIELLTVMSIIMILIGLLVPALNKVRRYAREVKQKAQFHSISAAIELFNTEFESYPPSDARDEIDDEYCGAMKLCEAMVGQDLLGFHPDSRFNSVDGTPPDELYPDTPTGPPYTAAYLNNLKARKGPYLPLENADAYRLKNLFPGQSTFDGERFVLCDVYKRVTHSGIDGTGKKVGMPILYYRADTSNNEHDSTRPDQSIYNWEDNDELVLLGMPWNSFAHPIAETGTTSSGDSANPAILYEKIKDDKIDVIDRPCRVDSYILISAGFDGEYGTSDDVFNFEK